MLVFGTQVHIVTFIFIVLEFIMFCFQFIYYLFRPQDTPRKWYLILLALMLFYNITGGLFPDPNINSISVSIQEMIAYGSGFLMASYFPFYFYKAFALKALRWHSLFGVPLFLMCPYLLFFVIVYAINGNLDTDIRYGMIVPFIYAMTLLWVMFRAIRKKHLGHSNKREKFEELAMYFAITPWASLAVFGFVEESQLFEVLCTNTGIIAISVLFVWNSVTRSRLEYRQFMEMMINGVRPELFTENCLKYHLTNREIEIAQLIRTGLRPKEIGDRLFIAERTVTTHLQNMMNKTQTRSRMELIRKLETGIFDSPENLTFS
jgi:DNA-binding CsgD family transcriptional regulator